MPSDFRPSCTRSKRASASGVRNSSTCGAAATTGWSCGRLESSTRRGFRAIVSRPCSDRSARCRSRKAGERADVRGPGLVIAERVDDQGALRQPERAVEPVQQGDDLHIRVGVVGPDDLGIDLEVLAVARGLRRLVAEVGTHGPRLPRHGRAMLAEGSHEAGGDLGADRHPPAALVLEVVHLLAHDVRGVAHPEEHLQVLDERREHQTEAGPLGVGREDGDQRSPPLRLGSHHIGHAAGSLERGHGGPG